MRIREEVEECVKAVELVKGDGADGLLPHRALICIAGTLHRERVREGPSMTRSANLIVVWESNEARNDTKDGRWIDLQVRGGCIDVRLANGHLHAIS